MLDDGLVTSTSLDQVALEQRITATYADLAQSGAPVADLLRRQHVQYLHTGLGALPNGFVALDAGRPWICYWVVHALALLDAPFPADLTPGGAPGSCLDSPYCASCARAGWTAPLPADPANHLEPSGAAWLMADRPPVHRLLFQPPPPPLPLRGCPLLSPAGQRAAVCSGLATPGRSGGKSAHGRSCAELLYIWSPSNAMSPACKEAPPSMLPAAPLARPRWPPSARALPTQEQELPMLCWPPSHARRGAQTWLSSWACASARAAGSAAAPGSWRTWRRRMRPSWRSRSSAAAPRCPWWTGRPRHASLRSAPCRRAAAAASRCARARARAAPARRRGGRRAKRARP